MAKRTKQRNWSEAELIDVFSLRKNKLDAPLLQQWLDAQTQLDPIEQYIFDTIHHQAAQFIEAWSEEDLKMNFIAFVILLAHLQGSETVRTFFDKSIEATVEGHFLKTKTDFMIAKGILDLPKVPYFHFQEYKKDKDPYGDPLAQLLEAFLIALQQNQNQKPLYGCYVIGRHWYFVVMQEKEYCVSMAYDCTVHDELLQIIAVLRQFKTILETVLLTSQ